jgi:hypothetical protein
MAEDLPAEFKRLAHVLVEAFSQRLGVSLKYDHESLEYLDDYIKRGRKTFEGKDQSGLVKTIGSFLGECIIANYGGHWKQDENGNWGIYFDDKNAVFPFVKVRKSLAPDSEGDSIAGFYDLSKMLRDGELA